MGYADDAYNRAVEQRAYLRRGDSRQALRDAVGEAIAAGEMKPSKVDCHACGGSGGNPPEHTCPTCGGKGEVLADLCSAQTDNCLNCDKPMSNYKAGEVEICAKCIDDADEALAKDGE